MPKPPGINVFDQVKFVTNYLLAGCGDERDLVFELNTEALGELALLIFAPSMEDIVQAFFDPKKGRKTKPDRHGKKRRFRIGIPDLNTELGQRATVPEIRTNFFKLPGARYALGGLNFVEAISITSALVETSSDIVFDNVLGLLEMNPGYCREFPRFRRSFPGPQAMQAPGGGPTPFHFFKEDAADAFNQGSLFARNPYGPWALSMSVTETPGHPDNEIKHALRITSDRYGIVAQSPWYTAVGNSFITMQVNATAEQGEALSWSLMSEYGIGNGVAGQVVGYGQSGWLDWLD